ncbi:MAG: hypothetical protein AB7V07_00990 [Candidatus Delongbacteria bacterium]
MPERIILYLLFAAFSAEILYILLRNPKLRSVTIPFFIIAVILSGFEISFSFSLSNFVSLSCLILLLTSRIFLKNKPFEKPDYKYLLILAGTIMIHI